MKPFRVTVGKWYKLSQLEEMAVTINIAYYGFINLSKQGGGLPMGLLFLEFDDLELEDEFIDEEGKRKLFAAVSTLMRRNCIYGCIDMLTSCLVAEKSASNFIQGNWTRNKYLILNSTCDHKNRKLY